MNMTDWVDKVKPVVKWVLRPAERKKAAREAGVRSQQDQLLPNLYPVTTKKLIVFFLDSANLDTGKETVSGGLLSIHSLFEETIRLKQAHGAEVLLCTVKGAILYFEFSTFQTPHRVFRYQQLETYFKKAEEIIAHVPEYMIGFFLGQLQRGKLNYLTSRRLHINILNQNIQLMPPAEIVAQLQPYVVKLTQTTAHERYANAHNRALYGIPLHHFSTFIAPERYTFLPYGDKKDRIAFSPDNAEKNALVMERLRKELPEYEIVVIGGMTYEQFKEFISKTKFTFTFGEGLDGYYCETVLTGGICFAVYNEEFFTPDFGTLETVHKNFEALIDGCVAQIRRLNAEESFQAGNRLQFDLLTEHYQFANYQENIGRFYRGEYTFK